MGGGEGLGRRVSSLLSPLPPLGEGAKCSALAPCHARPSPKGGKGDRREEIRLPRPVRRVIPRRCPDEGVIAAGGLAVPAVAVEDCRFAAGAEREDFDLAEAGGLQLAADGLLEIEVGSSCRSRGDVRGGAGGGDLVGRPPPPRSPASRPPPAASRRPPPDRNPPALHPLRSGNPPQLPPGRQGRRPQSRLHLDTSWESPSGRASVGGSPPPYPLCLLWAR